MPQEHQKELSIGLNWFIRVFKPAATRLLKILLSQKYFGAGEPDNKEVIDAKSEFFEKVLPMMESMLAEKEFLCTNQTFSALDILYYNELGGILMIYNATAVGTIIGKLPKIEAWM